MFLNLSKPAAEKEAAVIKTVDLVTKPGSQVIIKKLQLVEYLMSRDDLRHMYAVTQKANDEANKDKKPGEPLVEKTFLVPNACTLSYALVDPDGKRVFEGMNIEEVVVILMALPIDMYTEIAMHVEELNPTTFEAITEKEKQAKLEKEAEEVAKKSVAVASEVSTA